MDSSISRFRFGLFPALCGVLVAAFLLYLNVTPRIALQPTLPARETGMRENHLGWPQTCCVYISGWNGNPIDDESESFLTHNYGHGGTVWKFEAIANNVFFAVIFIAAGIYSVEFMARRRTLKTDGDSTSA